MSGAAKLLWVALPLLLAGAWWLLLRLRGRAPERLGLNIALSLLLLAYLAATAGLGLFWVANQQLPVFDWHYLFGYLTLVLLLLHLGFNLPLVWRYWRRPRPTPPPAAGPRRVPRLLALAALLGLAALWLPWRRPLPPPPRDAGDGAAPPDDDAMAAVARLHRLSSHRRAALLQRPPELDWGGAPPPFKPARGGAELPLPPPASRDGAAPGLATLAGLLWHGAGVTARRGPLQLRAAPSSGALFSTELYLLALAWPGLAPGLWHYAPERRVLERLADPPAGLPARALGAPPDGAMALLLASARYARTGHKYGERSYRYLLADLGHVLENIERAAAALGLGMRLLPAFDEAQLDAALGLAPAEEGVLALARLDAGAQAPAAPPRWRVPASGGAPPGLTGRMHLQSSLRAPDEQSAPAPQDLALPGVPAAARPERVLALIAARRSRRRFGPGPLALADLAGLLGALTRVPPRLSAGLHIDLIAHAVEGLAPGAYRYRGATHALRPRGPAQRARTRAAALDQELVGEAAAVLLLSVERAALAADPAGPARGYRHALLEAGLLGERAYLEGQARGLGVCGVGAFFDDEAAALAGLDPARDWVLHFVAIGPP